MPAGLTVIQWVTDFSERIKQLQSVSKQVASNGSKVLKVRRHACLDGGGLCSFGWQNCVLGMGRGEATIPPQYTFAPLNPCPPQEVN